MNTENNTKNKLKSLRSRFRYWRYFSEFKDYGNNVWLEKGGLISRANEISLGSNVFISENFKISARNLTIGNNVLIGPNLLIECDNHVFKEVGKTMFETRKKRDIGHVTIEDDVWIGGNVIILKDVKIGEGSIIGAGSLVTKSMPPYAVCLGNPCRPVKSRFEEDQLKSHLEILDSKYEWQDIERSHRALGIL